MDIAQAKHKGSKSPSSKKQEIIRIPKPYHELEPDDLRWVCPEDNFKFETTNELEPLEEIVGQQRAIEAIRMGAELFSKGYNIFVSGLAGTGRFSTVKKILESVTTHQPITYDYCYVNNFDNPDQPRLIKLSKGHGKEFASKMNEVISFLRSRLTKLLDEQSFQAARKVIIENYQKRERELLNIFDETIKPFGFVRGQIENEQGIVQPEIFPVIDKKPVQIETLGELEGSGKLSKKKAEELRTNYSKFHAELYELARTGMKMMQEFRKALADNDKAASANIVQSCFTEFIESFQNDQINDYINEVKKYILDNLQIFVTPSNSVQGTTPDPSTELKDNESFRVFEVNVILDNTQTECAPVVVETSPTYSNLFGTIERVYDNRGFWRTDFTKIKSGSLLKADQGYLIVNALDLFTEPGVWNALKRVLLYDKLEIMPFDAFYQFSQSGMKPEAIDVKVKVIIIGGQSLYRNLYLYEKGFKKIFKVNAQFDYETASTEDMIENYARFIAKICRNDNLPPCTPDGVAAIIEWAVEHAGSRGRITLKFTDVADILREAAFYDRGSARKYINREDVEKAIQWRRHRNDMVDEKILNEIIEGSLLIDTDGQRVGQINGLTVYDTGLLSFGKPVRITASISAGSSGIINVEREVDMAGSVFNKAILILNGFIREHFAQKRPLALSASIAFEQSYSGIDGDSATAAEIFVLLSALSRLPIKQSLAITGSVNQKGDIQPIGGINEKTRGFFEVCEKRGLTGTQGVIMPHQNVKDLMLCNRLINAVREGKFHIYAITSIEEAAELLMGLPLGMQLPDGSYPENTIYGKVEKRLEELYDAVRDIQTPKVKIKKKKA